MAEITGIAWCDHTFNPWIGCTKVSPGCDHCYAEALDRRHRWKGAEHWGPGVPRMRTGESNWREPMKWDRKAAAAGERRLVFCSSLADVFDNEVPEAWRHDLMRLIAGTPHLTWLLLTKRIGNAAKMLAGYRATVYPNVWLGASVVNQEEADRDLPKLLCTPAVKRFVSYEPALGPINFERYFEEFPDHNGVRVVQNENGLDWIIVGGESAQGGAKARPFETEWAYSAIEQCRAAGIACFVKQLGSNIVSGTFPGIGHIQQRTKDRAGSDPTEWLDGLRVRQFPR